MGPLIASGPAVSKSKGGRKWGARGLRKPEGHNVGDMDKEAKAFKKSRELLESLIKGADFYLGKDVSLLCEGSRTTTGWNGKRPPPPVREQIQEKFKEGTVGELLVNFTRIPHSP